MTPEMEKEYFVQVLAEMATALSVVATAANYQKSREFILGACFMGHMLAQSLPAFITDEKAIEAITFLVSSTIEHFPDDIANLHKRKAAEK